MEHKCRVYWLVWHWEVLCPTCGSIAWRFNWGNAITRALTHIHAQNENYD